mmetsp:Transcript_28688/g.47484  ORF Transcript_28688/g.47484 Transcript_28688/m.47484 type:complete len:221 (-) Transcript_28688:981-1643(-)
MHVTRPHTILELACFVFVASAWIADVAWELLKIISMILMQFFLPFPLITLFLLLPPLLTRLLFFRPPTLQRSFSFSHRVQAFLRFLLLLVLRQRFNFIAGLTYIIVATLTRTIRSLLANEMTRNVARSNVNSLLQRTQAPLVWSPQSCRVGKWMCVTERLMTVKFRGVRICLRFVLCGSAYLRSVTKLRDQPILSFSRYTLDIWITSLNFRFDLSDSHLR